MKTPKLVAVEVPNSALKLARSYRSGDLTPVVIFGGPGGLSSVTVTLPTLILEQSTKTIPAADVRLYSEKTTSFTKRSNAEGDAGAPSGSTSASGRCGAPAGRRAGQPSTRGEKSNLLFAAAAKLGVPLMDRVGVLLVRAIGAEHLLGT